MGLGGSVALGDFLFQASAQPCWNQKWIGATDRDVGALGVCVDPHRFPVGVRLVKSMALVNGMRPLQPNQPKKDIYKGPLSINRGGATFTLSAKHAGPTPTPPETKRVGKNTHTRLNWKLTTNASKTNASKVKPVICLPSFNQTHLGLRMLSQTHLRGHPLEDLYRGPLVPLVGQITGHPVQS